MSRRDMSGGQSPGHGSGGQGGTRLERQALAVCPGGRTVKPVRGLMLDFQLPLPTLMRRAESYFPAKEIVSRRADGSFDRTNYRDLMQRSRHLAVALKNLGL